jgi:hypothetical protein
VERGLISGGAKQCELVSVMNNLTAHLRRIWRRLRLAFGA